MRNKKTLGAMCALFAAVSIATWSAASPGPVAQGRVPPAAPPVRRIPLQPLQQPEITAMMLGALTRYANGTAATPMDHALAARLATIPNARAVVKSLVGRIQRTPLTDRTVMLPGVADVSGGIPIDVQKFRAGVAASARPFVLTFNDRLQDQQAQSVTTEEIDYAGVTCKTAPQTVNAVAIYAAAITYTKNGYVVTSKTLPASGSISGLTAGKTSTAAAGAALVAPKGFLADSAPLNFDFLLFAAALPDDGALAQHQSDMATLIGTAETFALMAQGDDKIKPLATSLGASLNLLVLADPSKWTPHSASTQLLSSTFANAATQTTDGVPWKFQLPSDTAGSDLQLLFTVPPAATASVDVRLDIQEIRLVQQGRSITPPAPRNLFVDLSMVGNEGAGGGAGVSHHLGTTNDARVAWSTSRRFLPGQPVTVYVNLWAHDPRPAYKLLTSCSGYGWGLSNCQCTFCGDDPHDHQAPGGCVYKGQCAAPVTAINLSPVANRTSLVLKYDPASGAITGDVTGSRGKPLTATGPQGAVTFSFP